MRKTIAIFIAIFLFNTGVPVSSFAKEKDKKHHLSHRQKKNLKRMKKLDEKVQTKANDYRIKPHEAVGIYMFKRQTPKVQKWRSKNHLKP